MLLTFPHSQYLTVCTGTMQQRDSGSAHSLASLQTRYEIIPDTPRSWTGRRVHVQGWTHSDSLERFLSGTALSGYFRLDESE